MLYTPSTTTMTKMVKEHERGSIKHRMEEKGKLMVKNPKVLGKLTAEASLLLSKLG